MRGEREKQHDIGKEERRPEKVRERERGYGCIQSIGVKETKGGK